MGTAGYGMFFMFGSFDFIMGTFVYFFVPETKGLTLEKMDELFGVPEQTTKRLDEEPEVGRIEDNRVETIEDDGPKKK
jgi:hypothetical protein